MVVDGLEIGNLGERELTRYRADKIGFVFQQFHLVPYLTAVENVMLAQYFHSITDEKEAAEALGRVGLGDRLEHVPAELSGGEQQRVAIARALINQPKLILADEPTGNLDEANEAVVLKLLRELHETGHTILVVTHSQAIGNLADRRVELEHGRLARISAALAGQGVTQPSHAHSHRCAKKTGQRQGARVDRRGRRHHLGRRPRQPLRFRLPARGVSLRDVQRRAA